MNDLDRDVEPIIVPLIRNRTQGVTEDERVLLATWATKIAFLLEHTVPSPTSRGDGLWCRRWRTTSSTGCASRHRLRACGCCLLSSRRAERLHSRRRPSSMKSSPTQMATGRRELGHEHASRRRETPASNWSSRRLAKPRPVCRPVPPSLNSRGTYLRSTTRLQVLAGRPPLVTELLLPTSGCWLCLPSRRGAPNLVATRPDEMSRRSGTVRREAPPAPAIAEASLWRVSGTRRLSCASSRRAVRARSRAASPRSGAAGRRCATTAWVRG